MVHMKTYKPFLIRTWYLNVSKHLVSLLECNKKTKPHLQS